MKTISHIIIAIFICISFPAFASAGASKGNDTSIQVKNGRLWIDVKDVEISTILKEIGKKTNIDIFIDKSVKEKITLKADDASIEDILKRICHNRSIIYRYLPESKTYRIIGVGAYSSEKGRGEKISGRTHKPPLKDSKTGEFSHPISNSIKTVSSNASTKTPDKMYDSKGRLLYKPGELLIKFKKGITDDQIKKLHDSLGSKVLKSLKRIRLHRIKLKKGLSENQAIQLYLKSGLVDIAEKHALRYPNSTIPNDEFFNDQWGLTKIQAPQAWSITKGSPDIIIAVIDTGVDYLHPDLMNNIWINEAEANGAEGVNDDGNKFNSGENIVDDIYGWDFADNDANPIGIESHGTHVAGIIGAMGNNGIGVTGVNWNIKIMVLKVAPDNGLSWDETDIIEAIDYAIDKGARVVNCSYGGEEPSDIEKNAFIRLQDEGILAVCAAGNEENNNDNKPEYPASYDLDNIISVAASDQSDNLASFSNYGITSVDVMAPGVDIKSTVPGGTYTEASVLAGDVSYNAIGMEYAGTTGDNGITAVLYDCGKGYNDEFPDGVNGNIALIERGKKDEVDFYFYQKVNNAQNHGAIGVIIYNDVNNDSDPNDDFDQNGGTLITPGEWIPAVSITQANGKALISLGLPRNVIMVNKSVSGPSSYTYMEGTSMAAPFVSGIAGLIISKYPNLGYSYVKSAILNSVDKIDSVSDKLVSGGRVNAWSALCSINMIPGDLSCDGQINLSDAIIALQIVSGFTPDICSSLLNSGLDINGDGKPGIEEAIYILQTISIQP